MPLGVGYRVYCAIDGDTVVVLLKGDKSAHLEPCGAQALGPIPATPVAEPSGGSVARQHCTKTSTTE